MIAMLALLAASPRLATSAQTMATPEGGTWRPLPGGFRTNTTWIGTELVVFGTDPWTWDRYNPATHVWRHMNESGAPGITAGAVTAWTGTQLLVWGEAGRGQDSEPTGPALGARYDPAADTWRPISSDGAPTARTDERAVWTGHELLVWGGSSSPYAGNLGDGAAYNPATDTWRPISAGGAPSARSNSALVWTGSEMLVLGGYAGGGGGGYLTSGAAYNPATDTWRTLASLPLPIGGEGAHNAVWDGHEALLWPASVPSLQEPGLLYDPQADAWQILPPPPDIDQVVGTATAVWSGGELLVVVDTTCCSEGGPDALLRYDPLAGTWAAPTDLPPSPGFGMVETAAAWTGDALLVWRGADALQVEPTTGVVRVSPAVMDAPSPRSRHTLTWTGIGLVAWGGITGEKPVYLGDGALYDPPTHTWRTLPTANAPSARAEHTAVWSGRELLVWGGQAADGPKADGGGLDLARNVWRPLATDQAPAPRWGHSAVWTGREMIVWGGTDGQRMLSDGGRYDPASDTWRPLSTVGAPSGRMRQNAVWTGSAMVIWGGDSGDFQQPATGGAEYDPNTDTWSTLPTSSLASAGTGSSLVWTGTTLLVTQQEGSDRQTGSSLDLRSGRWSPLGEAGQQTIGRTDPSTVWTGHELLVWGGFTGNGYTPEAGTGASYDPSRSTWEPLPLFAAGNGPAVWGDGAMYVWGGGPPSLALASGDGASYAPPAYAPPAPPAAPALAHDDRYFPATGFRLDNDAIWAFFQSHGGEAVLGEPQSRIFVLWGCPVQIFALRVVQACPGVDVQLLPFLASAYLPVTEDGDQLLPAPDPSLSAAAPPVDDPSYVTDVVAFLRAQVPDTFEDQPVNFLRSYVGVVRGGEEPPAEDDPTLGQALADWGLPLSLPTPDPQQPQYVYQRFQRALMAYDSTTKTTQTLPLGVLLREALLDAADLPNNTREELGQLSPDGVDPSPYLAQYCPAATMFVCRPHWLWLTDLTSAFAEG